MLWLQSQLQGIEYRVIFLKYTLLYKDLPF